MARSVTLAVLRTRAKQRADKVNASTPTDAEWNYLIDESYAEVHSELVNKQLGYFEERQTITGDGTKDYNLPSDHYATLAVARLDSDFEVPLKQVGVRGKFKYKISASDKALAYRVSKTSIELYPPPSGGTYYHYYAPCAGTLDDDTDTIDGVNGFDALVVVTAAIKALMKEESPVGDLERERMRLMAQMDVAAEARMSGDAGQVEDVEGQEMLEDDYFLV